MVLKIKIFILFLFLSNSIFANDNGEIFFTDKYDANYYSSQNVSNTKIYFGSDLFKFLSLNSLQTCGAYIDSFLRTEEIFFDTNLSIENENRFKVELGSLNAQECYDLSVIWSEKYKINFQKILYGFIRKIDFDSIEIKSENLIFKKLIIDELPRFYSPANSVNNTNIAFVMPKSLSSNKFKKVFTHYNTKRYSSREAQLSTTEILYNDNLESNQIKYSYPSLNRQSFLKNCLSLSIIESLFKESISFKTEYNINQCISSFTVSSSQENLTDLKILFNELQLSQNEFSKLTNESMKYIVKKSSESLFYFSFYDIEKLKALKESFDLKLLNTEITSLNNRSKFILEVSRDNNFYFDNNKIQNVNLLDFQKDLLSQKNSVDFKNQLDTNIISKLVLFMHINKNYNLSIIGEARRSEYLFIEKAKKDSLMNKYSEFGYRISKRKDLALYRSLVIFEKLTDSGISYNRMQCVGRKSKTPKVVLNVFNVD